MMVVIKAEKRQIKGKAVRKLRRQGYVPASIDRPKGETVLIKIPLKEANKLLKLDGVELVKVQVEGNGEYECVVVQLDIDPLNNKIYNINLAEITEDSHITVRVPIKIKGISPAVKSNIGVLLINNPYIKVVVNKNTLIPYLEIDISNLTEVGQRVVLDENILPEGVKLANYKDLGQTLLTIRPPQKAVVKQEEEALEGEESAPAAEGEAAAEPTQSSETAES